jgi:hypothetical protein
VGERRISVGLPQLLHDQAPDIVRRYAVRAEELAIGGTVRDDCRVRLARAILPLALLAGPLLVVPARAPAATCSKLPNTPQLRAELRAAHARLTDRPFSGPRKNQIYVGRCGPRSYALASFKDRDLGFQDQPERFTRRGSSQWKDRGDTGGDVCFAAPTALLRIWGLAGRC